LALGFIFVTLAGLAFASCQRNALSGVKVFTPTPTDVEPEIHIGTPTPTVVQMDVDSPVLNQELQPTLTPFVYSPKQGVPENLTYDLIWLEPGEGVIKRLSRETGEISTFMGSGNDAEIFVPGKIWKYAPNESGQTLAVVVENAPDDGSSRTFRLYAVNLFFNSVQMVYEVPWEWEETQPFKEIAPSPDGIWIAFIEWQYRVIFTGQDLSQHVAAVVRTDGITAPIVFNNCVDEKLTGCYSGPILWASDSLRLSWRGGGVWFVRIGSQARVIIGDEWEERTAIVVTRYSPRGWSPSGQYLLFDIEGEDGNSIGIYDTALNLIAELPRAAYNATDPEPSTIWLTTDERLLMLRGLPDEETGEVVPTLMMVRMLLTTTGLGFETTNVSLEGDIGSYVFAPYELPYRRISFASMDYDADGALVFDELRLHDLATYVFDVATLNEGVYLGGIPDCDNRLHTCGWLPDGSAMFFRSQFAYKDLYVPADGGEVYDLRPIIGDTGCCFNWIR
jgi:hypothetical protein